MDATPLLSLLLFLPALGCLPLAALAGYAEGCRRLTLMVTAIVLIFALALVATHLDPAGGLGVLSEDLPWIPQLGIHYRLRADGITMLLILLTALLTLLSVLVSWRSVQSGVAAFHGALLLVETSVFGIFLADDLFLFYLFWELQLLPIFLIIGRWGHERRLYAAIKFLIFSMAGSLLILAGVIALFVIHGRQTGDYTLAFSALKETRLDPGVGNLLFFALAAGFAVKIPMVPLHTWLPDAHTEAPTAGSVILAGLLLKTGAYALFRFAFPLFPLAAAANATILMVLGLIGLFYASWIAMAQSDMKRLVAYSSIGHMGLVVIGIAVWQEVALTGAVLQMINHGLTTAALFILVGMVDERFKTRELGRIGGLWQEIPIFSGFFLFFALSAIGLPGTNNFVSEMLILLGTFRPHPLIASLGLGAMVLTLVYLLRLVRETLFGPFVGEVRPADLSAREAAILVPLGLLVLWIGLCPGPLLSLLKGPVTTLLTRGG